MKNLYALILLAFVTVFSGCGDDENKFSLKPLIGFASSSGYVLETNTTGTRIRFYTNTPITEPVTLKILVNNIDALTYGVDFTTDPEPVDNVITVTIDPEDDQPSFWVIPGTSEVEVRKVNFQIIEVSGNGLSLGQFPTLTHTLSITKTEILPSDTRTIKQIRDLFTGTPVTIVEDIYLEGTIISLNDNVTAKSVYIQDASAAIVLRLVEDNLNTFKRGDRVRVKLQGTSLSAFNGLLQVNMPKANGTVTGTAPLPTPRTITIDELNAATYESQLVTITGVTFPAANGTLTVVGSTNFTKDGKTGVMRVEAYSSFPTKVLPSGTVTLTGIASMFNTGQLIPQTASDIP